MEEPLLTRIIPAPARRVFEAWTNPVQLSTWGMEGYSIPLQSITIQPYVGGNYDYCLVDDATKQEYWLRNKIVAFVPNKLLILELAPMPEQGFTNPVITRIELDEKSNSTTRLTFYRDYPPARRESARANWESVIDALVRFLAKK